MNLHDFEKRKALSTLSTFGIGGYAGYFTEIRSYSEMQEALILCKQNALPFHILGKGSNSLFSDRGINGVVLLDKIDFIRQVEPGRFHVGAGTSFSLLGTQTARQGWSGLEFASGIPASVGGAVFMNAGANGTDTSRTLVSVDFIDNDGILKTFLKEDLHFSYRTSSFQTMRGAIVGALFQLAPLLSAGEKRLSIIRSRHATQPYKQKSAGCIFRNPPDASAGALIEACGLKGKTIGGAQVSTLHANFIVNIDRATAKDVLQLIEYVKSEVAIKKGILLETEIRIFDESLNEFSKGRT